MIQSQMKHIKAFIDTNIFLHFETLSNINWPKELGADSVLLVVAPVVIRELDEQKDRSRNSTIQQRARASLKTIEQIVMGSKGKYLAESTNLVLSNEPQLEFDKYGLRADVNDDHLIACALEESLSDPSINVVVVSDDTGPRLKAFKHGIESAQLADRLKLPSAADGPEKENKRLLEQIQKMENSFPKLVLGFDNGDSSIIFELQPPIPVDKSQIESRMDQIKNKYYHLHPDPEVRPESLLGNVGALASIAYATSMQNKPDPDEYDRYNKEIDQYYKKYEKYLASYLDRQNSDRLTIQLDISLFNKGTAPARDVDVFMHFPDGFTLIEARDRQKDVEAPAPPALPRSRMDKLLGLSLSVPMGLGTNFGTLGVHTNFNPSNVWIKRTGSYDVSFGSKKIKQHMHESCDTMLLQFDSTSTARPFVIDYKINAENIPNEIEGKLNVIVKMID